MRKMTATCAALVSAAAFTAHADDQVFVGSPQGTVYVADSDTGEFTYFACFCFGPIVSIQPLGSDLLIGDSFGTVWTIDGQTSNTVDAVWVASGMLDMAINGDELLVVSQEGELIRAALDTGATIETFETPASATSVVVFDGTIYVGGTDGSIHSKNESESEWTAFGQMNSAVKTLGVRSDALIAADNTGQAKIIDWEGIGDDSYYVTTDTIDAGSTGNLNLFTQAPGAVHAFDADSLELVDTWTLPVPASAIFVRPGNICKADTNRNGTLEAGDLSAWIAAYNRGDFIADQNNDLNVTPTDFTAWVNNYNNGCE
ncbi:MAG: hypothetical protein ED559_00500 [Phycisphaera sp.]|nr:MAG: hypothetical protein ED559_00500 [Phycisphaera sp.]